MGFLSLVGIVLVVSICVYSILDRVCTCIENCKKSSDFEKSDEKGIN